MKALPKPLTALILLAGLGLTPTALADLIDRVFAVYDTDLNISWLKDANYAQTSGYTADGKMTWSAAMAWAAGLNVGGYTGWRLPTALNTDLSGPCSGSNCTGSELGHLFYTEGGLTQGQSITSSAVLSNLFSNMQNWFYFSGTEFYHVSSLAWGFNTNTGSQEYVARDPDPGHYAWAVRSGDVAAVPEPGVMGLLGIGAFAWAGTRARRVGYSGDSTLWGVRGACPRFRPLTR